MLNTLKAYYRFVRNYRGRYLVFASILVVAIATESVQPYFYKLFVDQIGLGDLARVWWLLAILVAMRIIALLLETISRWLADWVIIPVARDIRIAVFKKVQALDFAYHLSKSTGSLISAFKRGDSAIFSIHHIIDLSMAQIFIQFMVMLFFLSRVHPLTTVAMASAVVINLFATLFLIGHNVRTRDAFNDSEDELSAVITDNLLNFETVKLFAREQHELSRLETHFVDWSEKLWSFARSFRLIDVVVGSIGNISFAVVIGLGVWQLQNQTITAGDFVMVLGFISNFYYEFFELTYRLRDLAKNISDAQKYVSILDEAETVLDPAKPKVPKQVRGDITFDEVGFQYHRGKEALNDFSLRIKPGQTVAFVGHSGAGKSTVIKLLLRFFDPDTGAISIDGIDIRDMTKAQLRSTMGVVPQDPILFNTTIRHNICYGADAVTQKELEAAAKMANVSEFVADLPDGFDTKVGERGIKLSGGQKQRLAIARMMLSNPEIVIFDEATSQLDSESERQIQEAFWKVTKDKTTLVIAHRLSTVVKADKIVVMDQGQIIEQGSHRDLLRQGGKYAQFWKLQTLE